MIGSVQIFKRSTQAPHNLQNTRYLGDGDSASFKKVVHMEKKRLRNWCVLVTCRSVAAQDVDD